VTMTKRELVIRVANTLGMTQSDVAKIIEGTFDTISETLADGKRWELRDFGVFEVKTRASRIGRNPRTGDQVPVPERRVVTFRPGKKMKELVAGGTTTSEPEPAVSPIPEPAAPESPQAPPMGGGGDETPGPSTTF
jgi:integration host factor subunit alpha